MSRNGNEKRDRWRGPGTFVGPASVRSDVKFRKAAKSRLFWMAAVALLAIAVLVTGLCAATAGPRAEACPALAAAGPSSLCERAEAVPAGAAAVIPPGESRASTPEVAETATATEPGFARTRAGASALLPAPAILGRGPFVISLPPPIS